MGRLLQIRVTAFTYDASEVATTWPKLFTLAFPETSPSPSLSRNKGVLELVDSLFDQLRFEMMEPSLHTILESRVQRAKAVKTQLEEALANWQPQQANRHSDVLEEILDDLEKDLPRV